MEKTYIVEIQKEYNRIHVKWLRLHYKTSVGLVLFSFFVECILGWYLCISDARTTTVSLFILKFILTPLVLNSICIFIEFKVVKNKKMSLDIKSYIISLTFVAICFIIFTVHTIFPALYLIFSVPIFLTSVYAMYKLTILTAFSSIVAMIISELFISWDNEKTSVFIDAIRLSDFIISIIILLAISFVCLTVIRFEREKKEAIIQKELERHQLKRKVQFDELTGIYNRNAFHNAIKSMEEDTSDNKYIFAMIDIDNFKALNDNLGHVEGDKFLIEFGKIMMQHCKDAIPFRYGGDEFCIMFKNISIDSAVKVCEEIRCDLQNFSEYNNCDVKCTASFGITEYTDSMDSAELIINTDMALYRAKNEKNTIRVHDSFFSEQNEFV